MQHPTKAADDAGQHHSFRAHDGRTWRVRGVPGPRVPALRGANCLVFECDTACRRVWAFPADWRSLPDEDLERLSWGR